MCVAGCIVPSQFEWVLLTCRNLQQGFNFKLMVFWHSKIIFNAALTKQKYHNRKKKRKISIHNAKPNSCETTLATLYYCFLSINYSPYQKLEVLEVPRFSSIPQSIILSCNRSQVCGYSSHSSSIENFLSWAKTDVEQFVDYIVGLSLMQ